MIRSQSGKRFTRRRKVAARQSSSTANLHTPLSSVYSFLSLSLSLRVGPKRGGAGLLEDTGSVMVLAGLSESGSDPDAVSQRCIASAVTVNAVQ